MFKEKINPSDDQKDDVHDGFKDIEDMMMMTDDPVIVHLDNYDEAVTSTEVEMEANMKNLSLSPKNSLVEEVVDEVVVEAYLRARSMEVWKIFNLEQDEVRKQQVARQKRAK